MALFFKDRPLVAAELLAQRGLAADSTIWAFSTILPNQHRQS